MKIAGREIGAGNPPYIVAEISCNHGGRLGTALELIEYAKRAGADAVKFQAYEPDDLTIECDKRDFRLDAGPWKNRTLYDLYRQAQTPLAWFPALAEHARKVKITWFASVFSPRTVDLLEGLNCPAYKIASMEIVDLPLIRYAAGTTKPLIISTGMASMKEIHEARLVAGDDDTALLACVSGYPTPVEEANLDHMVHMMGEWSEVGLSDHTTAIEVPIAATALGAAIIEKHLRSSTITPDAEFSLWPTEFEMMVEQVHRTWAAMHLAKRIKSEEPSRVLRRSLYVVADMKAGDVFTTDNVRSIRPAYGMAPGEIDNVLGKMAVRDIERGTPLAATLITSRRAQ